MRVCLYVVVYVCVCMQHVITDWICEAEYVIELLTYLSVTSNKQILFADNTYVQPITVLCRFLYRHFTLTC